MSKNETDPARHVFSKGDAMKMYMKKPVEVPAVQWFKNGDHPAVGYYRRPEGDGQDVCKHCGDIMHVHGWIETLEGDHIVCPGDWIITGVKGEHYPCKPDIFEKTYEEVAV